MPNGAGLGVMALVSGTSATAQQLITEPTRQTSAFSERSLVRKPRAGAAQAAGAVVVAAHWPTASATAPYGCGLAAASDVRPSYRFPRLPVFLLLRSASPAGGVGATGAGWTAFHLPSTPRGTQSRPIHF
jgi:hypothetical protein